MANGDGFFSDVFNSLRGIRNLRRVDEEEDPEARRALEDEFIKERRERESSRKGLLQGVGDAVRSGNIDEALDPREELDPQRALERREREAGLRSGDATELQQMQQQVREIVQKRQRGEEISPEEKRIVFEVVFDAVKGLSSERERRLAELEQQNAAAPIA